MKKILSFLFLIMISFAGFSQVRISQVYGGAGGTYKNDFVELFNAGTSSVSLVGYSIQYGSAAGNIGSTAALKLNLTGSIQAGGYYLIGLASNAAGTNALPTPDQSGTIDLSGTNGKVALVLGTTQLNTASCSAAGIVDVVGYGTASCGEGTVVGALSTITAAIRNGNGCTDNGNNVADFTVAAPAPRNSATALSPCSGGPVANLVIASNITGLTSVSGSPSTTPATFTVSGTNLTGFPADLTVTATTNIEVAAAAGGPYSGSIFVNYTSATLSGVTLYARIKSTAPSGPLSGETITVSGGGAASSPSITVAGNVLAAEPAVQANNISITNITNTTFDINWSNGDGASRIVVIRATSATAVAPTDGTVYSAASSPSANTTGTGNFVLSTGAGVGPITFTGLTPGTSYTVQAYEYNGVSGTANYNTATAAGNPVTAFTTGVSPALQQSNFTGISVPLYMSPNAGRTPAMFFAKVTGLQPNTIYRYLMGGTDASDLGGTGTFAGLPVLIDHNNGNAFYYVSSQSITTANSYGTFTSDASGSFTGAFGLTSSSNTRFDPLKVVYPALGLGVENGASTVITLRYQLDQGITVLGYGSTATTATNIRGTSSATPKNVIGLWKSVDGSSFTAAVLARPLSMTVAEATGASGTGSWGGANFVSGYDALTNGAWNTLVPNNNPTGVLLIQQLDLSTGNVTGCSADTDGDGVWTTGNVDTKNPSGGTATPLIIAAADAPLTGASCFSIVAVNYTDFTAVRSGNAVKLNWNTQQEANSSYTEVLRSADGVNWKAIANVPAAGNSATRRNYIAFDNAPVAGKNFYKLRFVDVTGRDKASEIKTVLFSEKFEVIVSPNPVKDVITLNIAKEANNTPVLISLINSNGKIMGTYNTASTTYSINAAGFAKGLYILKLSSEGLTTTAKLIIQ